MCVPDTKPLSAMDSGSMTSRFNCTLVCLLGGSSDSNIATVGLGLGLTGKNDQQNSLQDWLDDYQELLRIYKVSKYFYDSSTQSTKHYTKFIFLLYI